MYQVTISDAGQEQVLRTELEAVDAIYWVNRLAELGYEADVVRTDEPPLEKPTVEARAYAPVG